MRFTHLPSSLLSLVAVALIQPVAGGLIPDLLQGFEDLQNLAKRCDNACGYYGQLCCASGESCYTDSAGQAQCGAGVQAVTQVADGNWQYYTTTYVQTDLRTVTATFSSYLGAAATAASCSYAQGQSPCGNTCCNSGQYCQQANVCVAVPGSSGYYSSMATMTVTNTAGGAASTAPFQTPVGTGGATIGVQSESSGGGLSGGAIAGIVIGVIAGIILLLLLCACCCFKGLLDGLLAIFGLGGRRRTKREEVEVIEERHHAGNRWYGNRPSGTVVDEKKKKENAFGGFAKAGLFLGGLAAILGLKRKRDERKHGGSSSGYSYYDSEYYTSSSSSSSGHRTRSRSRSRI